MKKEKTVKKKIKFNSKNVNKGSGRYKWLIGIIIWTFIISSLISYSSDALLIRVSVFPAFIILILIIFLGIIFDIIGVAVTAADETPFHSMASKKVKGAKTSVSLIRNADKVSNFCNDVIGDISGIISGGIGIVIINKIIHTGHYKSMLTLLISALIASVTVAGKAIGKNFAISRSSSIVYSVAWLIETIKRK